MTTAAAVVTTIRRASETLFVELPGGLTKAIERRMRSSNQRSSCRAPTQLHYPRVGLPRPRQGCRRRQTRRPRPDPPSARQLRAPRRSPPACRERRRPGVVEVQPGAVDRVEFSAGPTPDGTHRSSRPTTRRHRRLRNPSSAEAPTRSSTGRTPPAPSASSSPPPQRISALANLGRISIPRDRLALIYTLPDIAGIRRDPQHRRADHLLAGGTRRHGAEPGGIAARAGRTPRRLRPAACTVRPRLRGQPSGRSGRRTYRSSMTQSTHRPYRRRVRGAQQHRVEEAAQRAAPRWPSPMCHRLRVPWATNQASTGTKEHITR